MEKTSIFSQRKELKKQAHQVVRGHYLILVFLLLVMTLFGTEFRTTVSGWGKSASDSAESGAAEENPGNVLALEDVHTIGDVLTDIAKGDFRAGTSKADERSRQFREQFGDSKALGMTNGILGQVVNSVVSGQLLIHLGQTVRTATRSDRLTGIIFTFGAFLWYAMIFILAKNVYSAVVRRIFLEARVYRNISFMDVGWFARIRRWLKASWVMFVEYVYSVLWAFTIIGGIIKPFFSYFAVPYIVAENPSLSAKQAITLSRRMMNGHKMELLKYYITFLGWTLLGWITFGVTDLAYGNAYKLAAYTEFYVRVREEMLEREPDVKELLNDPYLFGTADRITLYETYFDVVDEIVDVHEKRVTISGWRRVLADWFGIWLYSLDAKKAYDEQESRSFALQQDKLSMEGLAYPRRLNPLWRELPKERKNQASYLRHYTVWTFFLLFITLCFIGWSWEVALHFMQTGEFANRGTLHGPWLPIYGTGGLIVMILCSRFRKKPVAEFITAIVLCGILEYCSGWFLEAKYHQRWWSYDGYFLNLHGRICAEGLLVFGVGCCAVVYLLAPAFDHMISRIKKEVLIGLCLVLGIAYGTDVLYSGKHPNMAEGAVEREAESEADSEAEKMLSDLGAA